MSNSVESAVGAALSLQNWAVAQEKDNLLLREVLDGQRDTILSLIDGAVKGPQLARGGMVGTMLHVTA